MDVTYYIIWSHIGDDSTIGNVVALNKKQAYEFASENFRKERGLPTSAHVNHKTLYETKNEWEAGEFYIQLMRKIEEERVKNAKDSNR